MKTLTIIARTLLGLIFVVFGLNAFFHFMPLPPPKGEWAGEFMKALFMSHYFYAIKCFEISGGLLLLSGRFSALGLTLIGPVLVNILLFHIFMDPSGLPFGAIMAALALFLLWRYRGSFAGLVRRDPVRTESFVARTPAVVESAA